MYREYCIQWWEGSKIVRATVSNCVQTRVPNARVTFVDRRDFSKISSRQITVSEGARALYKNNPFEAEEYYEHEDRLAIDDDYAKAMGERMKRRREERKREEQSWIDFGYWSFTDARTDRRCSTHQQATKSNFKCLRLQIFHSTYSGRLTGRAQEEATII